jgi:hypothetical protein
MSTMPKLTALLAIDPGPTESAYIVFDGAQILGSGIDANADLLACFHREQFEVDHVAIEAIQSFGMAVGAETFNTCIWIGRYIEAAQAPSTLVYRSQVKLHLCQNARAKDTNIRQALLDRYGGKVEAVGRKATPGPLYGIKSHCWSALAVAVTWWDQHKAEAA